MPLRLSYFCILTHTHIHHSHTLTHVHVCVQMITGDHPDTASTIGSWIGIETEEVLTGAAIGGTSIYLTLTSMYTYRTEPCTSNMCMCPSISNMSQPWTNPRSPTMYLSVCLSINLY